MENRIVDLVDGNAFDIQDEINEGTVGIIVKAGQGQLEYNWRQYTDQADRFGMPWGLYWLVDSRYSPESQKAAIKTAFPNGYFGKLGLWLDIEKPRRDMIEADYNKTPYHGYAAVVSVWRGVFAYSGIYPGWYFGPGSWDLICVGIPKLLQDEVASKCPAWIAHYTSAPQPDMRGSWSAWSLWQWREGPDLNRINSEWWSALNLGTQKPEYYMIERQLAEVDLMFTKIENELPLLDAVTYARENGWFAAMNGGAGFSYTHHYDPNNPNPADLEYDATHATPKTTGYQDLNGIYFDRILLKDGIVNTEVDGSYQAPWSVLAFRDTRVALIVTRGLEGSQGKTQKQLAEWLKILGFDRAYLMDSGRSSQIEENGNMLYWPYGPAEVVPQFIGFKTKVIGGSMTKGIARLATNIKAMTSGQVPAVTQLQIGQYVYGTLIGSSLSGDITGFSHFYKQDGTKIELGCSCKVYAGNMIQPLSNETEPGTVTPPPPVPISGNVHLEFDINSDGTIYASANGRTPKQL